MEGNENMKINAGRNVEVNAFEYYNYVGSVEFVNEKNGVAKLTQKTFSINFYVMGYMYRTRIIGY